MCIRDRLYIQSAESCDSGAQVDSSPLLSPSLSFPVHCARSSWPQNWWFGKKMTLYITEFCRTFLLLFGSVDFGQLIIINLNYTMKNPESKRMRMSGLWANCVKGLLKSCVSSVCNRKRIISLQTLQRFVSMFSSSCLSIFMFNRAIMCLPKNFVEEKEVKIYSQLGIHLCALLMKIDFLYFHFKVATILLNITRKDCLYF